MGTYRYFLAIFVALSHAKVTIHGLNPGVIAVISFLILSGFVMTKLVRTHYMSAGKIPAFYLDRALRLQPQYIFYLSACTIYYFIFGIDSALLKSISVESFILNALIIPTNFYMTDFFKGMLIMSPAWSLGLEACFYLIIPFLLILKLRMVGFICSFVVFLLAYSALIHTDYFGYRLIPGTLFIFLLGSYLADDSGRSKAVITVTFVASLSMLVSTLGFGINRIPYNAEVLAGIVIGLPIIALLIHLKRSSLDDELGNISYGVFLNHLLLIWIWQRLGMGTSTLPNLVLLLLVSTVLGWATYRLIERPVILLRRRLRQGNRRMVETSQA